MTYDKLRIHFPFRSDVAAHLDGLGLKYEVDLNEYVVTVDDVPMEPFDEDGEYQDPDECICKHYGIDYDMVTCVGQVEE